MSITTAILLGVLGGSVTTTSIWFWIDNKNADITKITTLQNDTINKLATLNASISARELEIKQQLTAPDLIAVACSAQYMTDHGDLLCREMFCRLQTREGDGASQVECEQIANVANSIAVYGMCTANGIDTTKCIDFVTRRK